MWTRRVSVFISALLLGAIPGCANASPYDPHLPSLYDPNFRAWWEGWEVRLLPLRPFDKPPAKVSQGSRVNSYGALTMKDDAGDGSLASASLVLGQSPRGKLAWNITMTRRVLAYKGKDAPSIVESFAEQLSIRGPDGDPIVHDPSNNSPPRFSIVSSPDLQWLLQVQDEHCVALAADDHGSLALTCAGPSVHWGPGATSPEGSAASLPIEVIGQHWFVNSLSTRVNYSVLTEGRTSEEGVASAFFSKHWGSSFPANGARILATSPAPGNGSDDVVLALEGGSLASPILPGAYLPEVWFFGFRAPNISWDIHSQDPAVYSVEADACTGTLRLNISQPYGSRNVEIVSNAPLASFYDVSGPSSKGIIPGIRSQSQAATVVVRLYEKDYWPWSKQILIGEFTFARAQIDFVGASRCGAGAAIQDADTSDVGVDKITRPFGRVASLDDTVGTTKPTFRAALW